MSSGFCGKPVMIASGLPVSPDTILIHISTPLPIQLPTNVHHRMMADILGSLLPMVVCGLGLAILDVVGIWGTN